MSETAVDYVNHPPHYTDGPPCDHCGKPVECITVTRRMGFNLGNATKYLWRAGKKGNAIEDLRKAAWYIEDEIKRLVADVACRQCGGEGEIKVRPLHGGQWIPEPCPSCQTEKGGA